MASPNFGYDEPQPESAPTLVGSEQLKEVNDLQYMALTMVINSVPVPKFQYERSVSKSERKPKRATKRRVLRVKRVARTKGSAKKVRK